MKIRVMGTREECADMARQIAEVAEILEKSEFYANRGESNLGRVYLEVSAEAKQERQAANNG